MTIGDPEGLSVSSSVDVTVSESFKTVDITPGQTELGPGQTRQFTAEAEDQFGDALDPQPAFIWSAPGGTISTQGRFTAPATCGDVRLTASSGSVSGTATVNVMLVALEDPELRALVGNLAAGGTLNRDDMIEILRAAGNDHGSVDQDELDDLNTILSHPAFYGIPNYVEVLAQDVVDGNVANARFQGQLLGNLVVGKPAQQMNLLVDKWFLGEVPSRFKLPGSTRQLRLVRRVPLRSAGAFYKDVHQGGVGDCYLLAAFGALASSNPSAIENMFHDDGDGTWTVRFYADGTPDYVTVDRDLPYQGNVPFYAGVGGTVSSGTNVLWVAMAEKAYAEWAETGKEAAVPYTDNSEMRDGMNSYAGLANGYTGAVLQQILGVNSSVNAGC